MTLRSYQKEIWSGILGDTQAEVTASATTHSCHQVLEVELAVDFNSEKVQTDFNDTDDSIIVKSNDFEEIL